MTRLFAISEIVKNVVSLNFLMTDQYKFSIFICSQAKNNDLILFYLSYELYESHD
jgi:hypothetical protein